MKKQWILIFAMILLLANITAHSRANKVKRINFGKYDQYAFMLYEKTLQFPKKNKLVAAVSVEVFGNIQCEYKFVLKLPTPIKDMYIWNIGEWKKLKQGGQFSNAITSKSITHILKGKTYIIKGNYSSGELKGYIRGLYKLKSLPLGKYKLNIYIDNRLIKTYNFKVYPPFGLPD